jgi:hypothetical protein
MVYVGSFLGITLDGAGLWIMILPILLFVICFMTIATEYKDQTFSRRKYARPTGWVAHGIYVFGVFAAAHFVLFLVEGHEAAPMIKDGEYVLSQHGYIVKFLSQSEYLRLKAAELRLFASGWMFFYSLPTAYWLFPANHSARRC